MFSMSMLPDLTPRDPHHLWYTSRSASSALPLNSHDATTAAASSTHQHDGTAGPHNQNNHHSQSHQRDRDQRRALVERTPLARLRHDEALMERRRANVSNYGSAWLKPPGVPKTLFQMREERREADEQAEALRREQMLNAQMAEAGALAEGEDGDDEPMEDDEEGEEQDLDDEIPDGEGFGFDGGDDDTEEEGGSEGDDETVTGSRASDGSGDDHAGAVMVSPGQQEEMRGMRAAEDRLREMMARGEHAGSEVADVFADDEEAEDMLEEEDLVHMQQLDPGANSADLSMGMDIDMDADLDGDIPEGYDDDDGYEHTDSDEEISDDGTRDISFAGRSTASGRTTHSSRLRRSLQRNHPRASLQSSHRPSLAPSDMDISGLLSNNESSFLDPSSPQMRRRG